MEVVPSTFWGCVRKGKELRAISVKRRIKLNPLSAQRPSYVCLMAKPIPGPSVGSSLLFSTAEAMSSNYQDKLTRLTKEYDQTMDLYRSACNEDQAMSAAEKEELKDKLTKLLKELQQTRLDVDFYNSCEKLQNAADSLNMNSDMLRLVTELAGVTVQHEPIQRSSLSNSQAEMSSIGMERMEGEGEGSVTAQYMDAIRSIVNEPLEDDDLLFSLSYQPSYFALSQRMEGPEHKFAHSQRTDGTENKNWIKGLGSKVSHVIYIGMRVAVPCIGLYVLISSGSKKFDDLALQLKALNEALGAPRCPPPTASVSNPWIKIDSLITLLSFGNPSITVSPPSGQFNHGNPCTVTSFSGVNIGQFKI